MRVSLGLGHLQVPGNQALRKRQCLLKGVANTCSDHTKVPSQGSVGVQYPIGIQMDLYGDQWETTAKKMSSVMAEPRIHKPSFPVSFASLPSWALSQTSTLRLSVHFDSQAKSGLGLVYIEPFQALMMRISSTAWELQRPCQTTRTVNMCLTWR